MEEYIKNNDPHSLVEFMLKTIKNTSYSEEESELPPTDTASLSYLALETFEKGLISSIDHNPKFIELILSYKVPVTAKTLRYAQSHNLDNKNFALLVTHCT
jgi:hypothetical protein